MHSLLLQSLLWKLILCLAFLSCLSFYLVLFFSVLDEEAKIRDMSNILTLFFKKLINLEEKDLQSWSFTPCNFFLATKFINILLIEVRTF